MSVEKVNYNSILQSKARPERLNASIEPGSAQRNHYLNFTGARAAAQPISMVSTPEIKEVLMKLMPSIFRGMQKLKNSIGEFQNIVINSLGTGLVAPILIKYNFLSKTDEDTRTYTAWRQPISAVLAVLTQALITIPFDFVINKMVNNGEFGIKYNLTFAPDEKLLKKEIKEKNKHRHLSKKQLNDMVKEQKNKQTIDSNLPSVKNINLHFEFGKSYLILGSSASGKRTLFYLLNKKLTPSSGSIFIDSKNIFDIPDEKYKQIISFTNKKPHFYNISISENLLMVCSNRSQVLKLISDFGLKEYIQNLPNKLNTIIDNKISSNLLFFLGILRAFLSGSKILVIYEIPDNFQKLDFDKLKKILEFLNKKCLVIIFSHEKTLSTLTNKTITIENGKTKS